MPPPPTTNAHHPFLSVYLSPSLLTTTTTLLHQALPARHPSLALSLSIPFPLSPYQHHHHPPPNLARAPPTALSLSPYLPPSFSLLTISTPSNHEQRPLRPLAAAVAPSIFIFLIFGRFRVAHSSQKKKKLKGRRRRGRGGSRGDARSDGSKVWRIATANWVSGLWRSVV